MSISLSFFLGPDDEPNEHNAMSISATKDHHRMNDYHLLALLSRNSSSSSRRVGGVGGLTLSDHCLELIFNVSS